MRPMRRRAVRSASVICFQCHSVRPRRRICARRNIRESHFRYRSALGLTGQPRVIVFHEKEGRRHCHAVWSRINAQTMTAIDMPFFKNKLQALAKDIYLENGWAMPKGFANSRLRDARNFSLDEWQQAKRAGVDPRELKSAILDCWQQADNAKSFAAALEERGLFLARGDQRSFVAVTIDGDVHSITRILPDRKRDIISRLGDSAALPSVSDTRQKIAEQIAPRLTRYIAEAKRIAHHNMQPLVAKREALKVQHQAERQAFDSKLETRWNEEQRIRSSRLRKGIAGAWDFLTGKYFKTRKHNEMESKFARERDSHERHALIQAQHKDRQALQELIKENRRKEAERILGLYRDAAKVRRMREGEAEHDRNGRTRDGRSLVQSLVIVGWIWDDPSRVVAVRVPPFLRQHMIR